MRLGYMQKITEKALNHTAHNTATGLYDTPSVLHSAHTAKVLCERRRDYTDLSAGAIRLIEQSTALYCAVLNAHKDLHMVTVPSKQFFNTSKNIAQKSLLVFGNFNHCQSHTEALRLALALTSEIESTVISSRQLRFSVLQTYGKITYALPELEFVNVCTDILAKSARLSELSLAVYNKFTLYT